MENLIITTIITSSCRGGVAAAVVVEKGEDLLIHIKLLDY